MDTNVELNVNQTKKKNLSIKNIYKCLIKHT